MAFDLILRNARLANGGAATVDIAVADGRIAAIEPRIRRRRLKRGCGRAVRVAGTRGEPLPPRQVADTRPRRAARRPPRDRLHEARLGGQRHVHGRGHLRARARDARAVPAERRHAHAHAHRGRSHRSGCAASRRSSASRRITRGGSTSSFARSSRKAGPTFRARSRTSWRRSKRGATVVGGAPRYDAERPRADRAHLRAREGLRRRRRHPRRRRLHHATT